MFTKFPCGGQHRWSFVDFASNVNIDCVVRSVYKYTDRPPRRIVVVGPDIFQIRMMHVNV